MVYSWKDLNISLFLNNCKNSSNYESFNFYNHSILERRIQGVNRHILIIFTFSGIKTETSQENWKHTFRTTSFTGPLIHIQQSHESMHVQESTATDYVLKLRGIHINEISPFQRSVISKRNQNILISTTANNWIYAQVCFFPFRSHMAKQSVCFN